MVLFGFFKKKPCDDRDGSSFERAVIIRATSTSAGIAEEYRFIEERHGPKHLLEQQTHSPRGDRHFDVMQLMVGDGERVTYYFDITSFYGRL